MALYRFGKAMKGGSPRLSDNQVPSGLDGGKLGAATVVTASIGNGAITSAQLANGAVDTTKLSSFLRQGCKYAVAGDQTIASLAAITFATKVFDSFNQVVGSNYQPVNNGIMHISAAVRLTGAGVIPGTSARLLLMNGSTQVLVGQEFPVLTDQWGFDVVTPMLNEAVSLSAGVNYTLVFEVGQPDAAHAYPTDASATVKASAATTYSYTNALNNTTVMRTVTIAGSYFQTMPVAQ